MNCDNVLPEVNPPSKKTSREIRPPRHNKSDDTIVQYEEVAEKKDIESVKPEAEPKEEETEDEQQLPPYASPSPILARTSYMNRLLKAPPIDPLSNVQEVIEEEEFSPEKGKARKEKKRLQKEANQLRLAVTPTSPVPLSPNLRSPKQIGATPRIQGNRRLRD